ncbi:MAG: nucleotidyltransferase domain-containing protein, partial [Verrucomicrobiota bacterium]
AQISDEKNDITYYELGRYAELLVKNNPNLMEMLFASEDQVRLKHPLMETWGPDLFLSKLCRDTFAGYAGHQIKKARGLNKKIVNPVDKERKGAADFCYVLEGQGSVPLAVWLQEEGLQDRDCGLVRVPHLVGIYGLYVNREGAYRGIFKDAEASDVRLSSVPREARPVAWMGFNRDGYKKYGKEYQSYWTWVEERNEQRYVTNVSHGRNYDSKNMMHTFRLLDMAEEIATKGTLTVKRPNREELMAIREGKFEYEELLQRAEEKLATVMGAFEVSNLAERPDEEKIGNLLSETRQAFYRD